MRIGAQGGLMHASCETQMPKWNPKNEKKFVSSIRESEASQSD
jgi:hypothetical protein